MDATPNNESKTFLMPNMHEHKIFKTSGLDQPLSKKMIKTYHKCKIRPILGVLDG